MSSKEILVEFRFEVCMVLFRKRLVAVKNESRNFFSLLLGFSVKGFGRLKGVCIVFKST